MKKSKMPSVEDLVPFMNNRKEAAKKYGVTEKTIINWLKKCQLCNNSNVYSSHKLDMDKAVEIRKLHKYGKTIKELSLLYNVTFSTISRVVKNVTYSQNKEVADIKVIYNPNPVSSSVFAVFESE